MLECVKFICCHAPFEVEKQTPSLQQRLGMFAPEAALPDSACHTLRCGISFFPLSLVIPVVSYTGPGPAVPMNSALARGP